MHIPFVCKVRFQFLAPFPVDHLADPVVSSIILLLCQFAAIAYYVIDGFILLLFHSLRVFHTIIKLVVSHWSPSDNKSPRVSRTLLSILIDFNAMIWMVSILPLISVSLSLFSWVLVTLRCAPLTIGITVILMFHRFYSFLAMSKYLFIFSLSFIFAQWFANYYYYYYYYCFFESFSYQR